MRGFRRGLLGALGFVLVATASPARAQIVNFDALPCGTFGAPATIPDGYAGLVWAGWRCYDVTTAAVPAELVAARTSGTNIAMNRSGSGATITGPAPFTLFSARVTDFGNSTYDFEGWLGATKLYTWTVTAPGPATLITFNFIGIDKVVLTRTAGGGLFAFDDFNSATPVALMPEPASIVLLASGLLGNGFVVRRRRQ